MNSSVLPTAPVVPPVDLPSRNGRRPSRLPFAGRRAIWPWLVSLLAHGVAFVWWFGGSDAPLGAGGVEVTVGELSFAPLPEEGEAEELAAPAAPESEPASLPPPDALLEPVPEEPVEVLELEPPETWPVATAEEPLPATIAVRPLRARQPDAADASDARPRETVSPPPSAPSAPAARAAGGRARGVPVVLLRVEPSYPLALRSARVEGSLSLHVLVGTLGEVRDVRVATSSGQSAFDEAALRALWSWRFAPPADPYWVRVPVRFSLS